MILLIYFFISSLINLFYKHLFCRDNVRIHEITIRWLKQCLILSKLFSLSLCYRQYRIPAEEQNCRGEGAGTQRLCPTKVQSCQGKETFGR